MTIFLQSITCELRKMVLDGYFLSKNANIVGFKVPTPRNKWDADHKKEAALNTKGMNAVICALSLEESNIVIKCLITKVVWGTLEATHEGSSVFKKLQMFATKFESIKM
eukprot:TRINITY_DN24844_c0_g1_i1.p1 TRINITY_DN24844_c0_g1~~TRINITY_DN24844_c0_g1_i1.p1  ORF type:complete len:109 (-),score=20.44 TRINITY_DN24844_c0_g1_i1:6-332(-)